MADAQWVGPVIGALIALAGVGVTQLITLRFRRQERHWKLEDESRGIIIDRGEELYSLVRKWWLNQIQWYGNCKLCMQGVIDYNTFLDRHLQSNEGIDLKVDRIDLIFSIYFCEIEFEWERCVELIRKVSRIENSFKQDYKNGIFSGEDKLREINPVMLKADKQIEATLMSIAVTVRKHLSHTSVMTELAKREMPSKAT